MTDVGKWPVRKGDPGTAVTSPVAALIVYTDNSFALLFAINKRFPCLLTVANVGPGAVGKGALAKAVKVPVLLATAYAEILLEP